MAAGASTRPRGSWRTSWPCCRLRRLCATGQPWHHPCRPRRRLRPPSRPCTPRGRTTSWDDGSAGVCAMKAKRANRPRSMSGTPSTKLTANDVLAVFEAADGRCVYCRSLAVESRPSLANGSPGAVGAGRPADRLARPRRGPPVLRCERPRQPELVLPVVQHLAAGEGPWSSRPRWAARRLAPPITRTAWRVALSADHHRPVPAHALHRRGPCNVCGAGVAQQSPGGSGPSSDSRARAASASANGWFCGPCGTRKCDGSSPCAAAVAGPDRPGNR